MFYIIWLYYNARCKKKSFTYNLIPKNSNLATYVIFLRSNYNLHHFQFHVFFFLNATAHVLEQYGKTGIWICVTNVHAVTDSCRSRQLCIMWWETSQTKSLKSKTLFSATSWEMTSYIQLPPLSHIQLHGPLLKYTAFTHLASGLRVCQCDGNGEKWAVSAGWTLLQAPPLAS